MSPRSFDIEEAIDQMAEKVLEAEDVPSPNEESTQSSDFVTEDGVMNIEGVEYSYTTSNGYGFPTVDAARAFVSSLLGIQMDEETDWDTLREIIEEKGRMRKVADIELKPSGVIRVFDGEFSLLCSMCGEGKNGRHISIHASSPDTIGVIPSFCADCVRDLAERVLSQE